MGPIPPWLEWIALAITIIGAIASLFKPFINNVAPRNPTARTSFTGFLIALTEILFGAALIFFFEVSPGVTTLIATVVYGTFFTLWALQNQRSIRVNPQLYVVPAVYFGAFVIITSETGAFVLLGLIPI